MASKEQAETPAATWQIQVWARGEGVGRQSWQQAQHAKQVCVGGGSPCMTWMGTSVPGRWRLQLGYSFGHLRQSLQS